jgi:hypothetical protein
MMRRQGRNDMLRKLNRLVGCGVEATDGDIGRIGDFLLDDERWTVRYLVVEPGGWLGLERVLVSPIAVESPADPRAKVRVRLTRAQVRSSPPLESQIVPRRYEADYAAYYGYPHYWVGGGLWGLSAYPGALAADAPAMTMPEAEARAGSSAGEPESHVRSAREITGYHIGARDGEIGHVDDFLTDASNWIGGKPVLVPRGRIREVNWLDAKIHVDLPREQIRSSPAFDASTPVSPEFEAQLAGHYGKP